MHMHLDYPLPCVSLADPPLMSTLRCNSPLSALQVGTQYVDAGATALEVPSDPSLPVVNLTSAVVTSGLANVNTATPTTVEHPYVIAYDVLDTAVPPRR